MLGKVSYQQTALMFNMYVFFFLQEQYQFIFDALVKHFYIGRTTMSVDSFSVELASLKMINKMTGETQLAEQFKVLDLLEDGFGQNFIVLVCYIPRKQQEHCL